MLCTTFVFLAIFAVGQTQEGSPLQPCRPTGSAVEGPYYKPAQPNREFFCTGDPAFYAKEATKLVVSGRVLDYESECRLVVPGAKVEVWQASSTGYYEDKSLCRSTLYTDNAGRYRFTTVHPGRYRLGRGFRPAHIHFKVSDTEGRYVQLTTQLYFEGDPYLFPNDACPGCSSGDRTLIVARESLEADVNGSKWFSGEFNVVLRRTSSWKLPPQPTCPIPTTPPPFVSSAASTTSIPTTSMVPIEPVEPRTSLGSDCPNVSQPGDKVTATSISIFDYVLKVKVKKKANSTRAPVKILNVHKIPTSLMESFKDGDVVDVTCPDGCKICRSAMKPRTTLYLLGLKKNLHSSGNKISLCGKSIICPPSVCKKVIRKTFVG